MYREPPLRREDYGLVSFKKVITLWTKVFTQFWQISSWNYVQTWETSQRHALTFVLEKCFGSKLVVDFQILRKIFPLHWVLYMGLKEPRIVAMPKFQLTLWKFCFVICSSFPWRSSVLKLHRIIQLRHKFLILSLFSADKAHCLIVVRLYVRFNTGEMISVSTSVHFRNRILARFVQGFIQTIFGGSFPPPPEIQVSPPWLKYMILNLFD